MYVKKRFKEKTSVGVMCLRRSGGRIEVLLVRKRYTYAYNTFIHSGYKTDADAVDLLDNMTVDEKLELESLNFQQIWGRVWRSEKQAHYGHNNAAFASRFLVDGGRKLKQLIARSKSARLLWEPPKGHRNRDETELDAAIREFNEETGMTKRDYLITGGVSAYSYVDNNIRYLMKYHIAVASGGAPAHPEIDFKNEEQVNEISDIKWCSRVALREMNINELLHDSIVRAMNYVKKNKLV